MKIQNRYNGNTVAIVENNNYLKNFTDLYRNNGKDITYKLDGVLFFGTIDANFSKVDTGFHFLTNCRGEIYSRYTEIQLIK